MTANEKKAIFVGALSGTMPLLVNLVDIDAAMILSEFNLTVFLGYIIKAIGLMILGGFIVFINSEVDLKKSFQLGIMAPAMIVGMLNANNLTDANTQIEVLGSQLEASRKVGMGPVPKEITNDSPGTVFQWKFSIISSAFAEPVGALKGEHTEVSMFTLLKYGITGNIQNGWFVISGSHSSETRAEKQSEELRLKGYDAKVFPPFGNSKYYGVVIGSYLTLEEAQALRLLAIKDGLPKDTYLWKWKP
jgi:hypothetical protein